MISILKFLTASPLALPGKEGAVAMAVELMQLHKDLMPGWEGTCELRNFATPPQ